MEANNKVQTKYNRYKISRINSNLFMFLYFDAQMGASRNSAPKQNQDTFQAESTTIWGALHQTKACKGI